jgi:hypothetical protein
MGIFKKIRETLFGLDPVKELIADAHKEGFTAQDIVAGEARPDFHHRRDQLSPEDLERLQQFSRRTALLYGR